LVLIPTLIGTVMKVTGMNIIGADQKGEIIF